MMNKPETHLGYHSQNFTKRLGSNIIFWSLYVTTGIIIMLFVQWGSDTVLIRLLLIIFDNADGL
jgi:hypothetical protein